MSNRFRKRTHAVRVAALATFSGLMSFGSQAAWVKVADENQVFTISGSQLVRFGAGSSWIEKTVSGNSKCDRFVFGSDPAYGVQKTCERWVADSTATAADVSVAALPATIAAGSGYAVDSVNGNDANPGTAAAPFRSLSRLRSVVLASGQGIYLRCGSVWRESLDLGSTHLKDNSVIAAYGSGCNTARPRITGANSFAGSWTKSGNLWRRTVPAGTPRITRLFVNGEPMRVAQWPNATAQLALSDSAAQQVIVATAADRATLSGKAVVGATVQTRSAPWWIDGRTVSSYDAGSGTMRLSSTTRYGQQKGQGYVLQDKLWMLDAPGEFLHDTATNTLYVYPTTSTAQANLNAVAVEGSVRATPLTLRDRAGLRVSGLRVDMGTGTGVLLSQTAGATLDQLEVNHNGDSGVRIQPRSGGRHAVRRSGLTGNLAYGIDASGAANVDIVGNAISDTGTVAWAGMSHAGIWGGDGNTIDDNVVNGAAYKGVRLSGTGGSRVTRNTIVNHCKRIADCGAIYMWNGPKESRKTANQSSLIESNIIGAGQPATWGAVGGGYNIVTGVYLDDYAIGVTVRGNIVHGVTRGIYVHNGSNNVVESNRIWMTTDSALKATSDQTDRDYMTSNTFRNNELAPVAKLTGTYPAAPKLQQSHAVQFSVAAGSAYTSLSSASNLFTGNQIVHLQGASLPSVLVASQGVYRWMSTADWRRLVPGEAAVSTPMTFGLYQASLGGELVPNPDFTGGLSGWSITGSGNVSALGSGTGCTGSCAAYRPANASASLSSSTFSVAGASLYLVKVTAGFNGTANISHPYIGRATSPFDSMIAGADTSVLTATSGGAGDTLRFESFSRTSSSGSARMHLKASNNGSAAVHMDGASMRAVSGYQLADPAAWSAFVYAPRSGGRYVDCSTLGWGAGCTAVDVDGASVGLPTTIPAGTARLLLRTNSTWRR